MQFATDTKLTRDQRGKPGAVAIERGGLGDHPPHLGEKGRLQQPDAHSGTMLMY
jgi:hypothetical protein